MVAGLLFDIDGVMVTSWQALPGAPQALREVSSLPRMFLTNTTSKSRDQIAQLLAGCGFDVAPEEILTAARLTAQAVAARYGEKRVWVLNEGPVAADMANLNLVGPDDNPEVVVLGGAGECFTHTALSRVLELMLAGVPAIAMHRSLTWSTAAGLRIDTGVYLEGLERATGREIPAVGKPAPLGFRTAVQTLGVDATEVAMIGDDLRGDVLGAQASALIGVLVRTGKFRQEALDRQLANEFAPSPDHVIDSVADLPDLIASLNAPRI